MNSLIKSSWYGLQTYEDGLKIQQQAYQFVQRTGKPVVIGLEHYPVITLGKRAQVKEEFSSEPSQIQKLGFSVHQTDRGGQATLHSPGQLVIYPIVPLKEMGLGVRDFVGRLQESTQLWLQTYKIKTEPEGDAGLKTDAGKILFIGIRVDQGITRHGIAINVCNNLDHFSLIRSCGVSSASLDSLQRRGLYELTPERAFGFWLQFFNGVLPL